MTLRMTLERIDALAEVFEAMTVHRVEIVGLRTERGRDETVDLEVDVRIRSTSDLPAALDAVSAIRGVHLERAGELGRTRQT